MNLVLNAEMLTAVGLAFTALTAAAAFLTTMVTLWRTARVSKVAAEGVEVSKSNAKALTELTISVDGRLTQFMAKADEVASQAADIAYQRGRDDMRVEREATAATLAELTRMNTVAATDKATGDAVAAAVLAQGSGTPIPVDVQSIVPVEVKESSKP